MIGGLEDLIWQNANWKEEAKKASGQSGQTRGRAAKIRNNVVTEIAEQGLNMPNLSGKRKNKEIPKGKRCKKFAAFL